jgi:hypothetical protein
VIGVRSCSFTKSLFIDLFAAHHVTLKNKEVKAMNEPSELDKTFNIIMRTMVEKGQAPHYTEIAAHLGVSVEEGRKALHDLFSARIPGWLFPNTDYITSFAPFNNLPTQHRITIDGQQKWFGQ